MESARLRTFSFLREVRLLLPDNAYFDVPEPITMIILSYYHISERFQHFDADHVALNVASDGSKYQITKLTPDIGKTVYGAVDIVEYPHALYQWTFNAMCCKSWLFLGIDSSNCAHVALDYTECNNKYPFYSFGAQSLFSHKGETFVEEMFEVPNWNEVEQVVMEVNTKDKTMQFYFDKNSDISVGPEPNDDSERQIKFDAFTGIDFDDGRVYRLAILLGDDGETITLNNFQLKCLK